MAGVTGTTTYRLDQAVVLRVVGPILVLIGILWAVLALLGAGTTARLILGTVTLLFVLAAAVAVIRPPRVLILGEQGFRVSLVRGAGTSAANWSEVESVDTRAAGGEPAVVFALSGGRSTVIPVSLLGRRNREARREIHDRLNDSFGYRHLDAS